MSIPYKAMTIAPISSKGCMWAVCYDVCPEQSDGSKPKTIVTAVFTYPIHAENFIERCLPEEARSRFYITQIKPAPAETNGEGK